MHPVPANGRFALRTLGRLALTDAAGCEEPSLATRPRKLALLAWLTLRPEQRATRDRLIGVFWGDRDEARARNSLSDAISHLRRVLGRGAIVSQASEVLLGADASLDVDVLDLLAAASRGDHARVLELYRGAFLDGFYINDAPEFEEWRERLRDRIARTFTASAAARCAELAREQSWPACHDVAERWLEADPDSTEAAEVLRCASAAAPKPDPIADPIASPIAGVIEPPAVPPAIDRIPDRSPRRRRPALVGAACIALVAMGLAMRRSPELDRGRVIVAAFENQTGDSSLAPLGGIAADWVSRGLVATHSVEVADPLLNVSGDGSRDPRAIGRAARAGLVVLGSYTRDGDSLAMSARLVDARTGGVLRTTPTIEAPASQPLAAIDAIRQRVFGALAAETDAIIAHAARGSAEPPTYEAYLAWVEGLDLYARREFRKSIVPLMHAAALDSAFVSPKLWALAAYGNLGEYARADSLLQTVLPSRVRMMPVDRGLADIWKAELRGDRLGRYAAAHEMLAAAPGSELSLYLAGLSAIDVNRPNEAAALLEKIPVEAPNVWNDYGTRLARAYHLAGRHREELRETERRLAAVPGSALAMDERGEALAASGDVRGAVDMANRVLATRRDESTVPAALAVNIATELAVHEHAAEARAVFCRILQLARAMPPQPAKTRSDQVIFVASATRCGALAAADSAARRMLDSAPNDLAFLKWHGVIAARQADTLEAHRTSARLAEVQAPYTRGTNTLARAEIAALLGEKAEATRLLRQAMDEGVSASTVHFAPEYLALHGFSEYEALVKPAG